MLNYLDFLYLSIICISRKYSITFFIPSLFNSRIKVYSLLIMHIRIIMSSSSILSGKIKTHGATLNISHNKRIVSIFKFWTAPDSYFWTLETLTCNLFASSSCVILKFFRKYFITSPVCTLMRLTFFKFS